MTTASSEDLQSREDLGGSEKEEQPHPIFRLDVSVLSKSLGKTVRVRKESEGILLLADPVSCSLVLLQEETSKILIVPHVRLENDELEILETQKIWSTGEIDSFLDTLSKTRRTNSGFIELEDVKSSVYDWLIQNKLNVVRKDNLLCIPELKLAIDSPYTEIESIATDNPIVLQRIFELIQRRPMH